MISTGITPFANDTFSFAAIEKGLVNAKHNYLISYRDIEELNQLALACQVDLIKISFNTLGKILDNYVLLPVGSCLGFNNGPKIIAKEKFSLSELKNKKIGVPGVNTTAYMLLKILTPHASEEMIFPYHELCNKVVDGTIDCALTIHESRFQIEELGLTEVSDIYELWTAKTDSPLPLGGLVARRSLGVKKLTEMTSDLQKSLKMAHSNKEMALNFAFDHSFKKDILFVEKNVDLYVNDESMNLSENGCKSLQSLLKLGHEAGMFPKPVKNWLFG
ncbi:MAG: MqnA/MqnD/SBP family protein [Oligoflexales bacterium]